MFTAIIFIIVLAILIFVHELGHFLAARATGIRVDAFKIGFGPRILHWKKGETEYGVNAIPFGGYVKIHGENPDEESLTGPDASRSFATKARWKQVMVLVAGVFFNFVFAWILYMLAFSVGVTATSEDFTTYADRFSNERIMVTYVEPGSPAAQAGVEVGDVLRTVTPLPTPTSPVTPTPPLPENQQSITIAQVQQSIGTSQGTPLVFGINRDDSSQDIRVTPKQGLIPDTYAVGIAMQDVVDVSLPVHAAFSEGVRYTLIMIRETVVGLYTFVVSIFRGTANFADVAGPVGIAGIVGSAADQGIVYLLMITALISINLGVINLIPFPALDGGRTLFVLIEGVIRRRISMKFTNTVNAVGFVLLMILMIVVTYKDIVKLFR